MEKTHISIAIDGPVAAGKTTQAKLLAKKLNILYVDTGAMYRAVAYYMVAHQKTVDDIVEVLNCIDLSLHRGADGDQRMFLGQEDVTMHLRSPEISKLASDVSAVPSVREFLLRFQQEIAVENDVVMEGRDIGTVILPHASVKIFLTAEPNVRARRRWQELQAKGCEDTLDEVLVALQQRDYNDSHRSSAPLKKAEDAILVDCTGLDVQKTAMEILNIVSQTIEQKNCGDTVSSIQSGDVCMQNDNIPWEDYADEHILYMRADNAVDPSAFEFVRVTTCDKDGFVSWLHGVVYVDDYLRTYERAPERLDSILSGFGYNNLDDFCRQTAPERAETSPEYVVELPLLASLLCESLNSQEYLHSEVAADEVKRIVGKDVSEFINDLGAF